MSFVVRFILRLFALLPLRVSQSIGAALGWIIFQFDTRAARVTRTNLELCMPDRSGSELESLVKRSLMETGKTFFETPAVWLGGFSAVDGWIAEVHNEHLLKEKIEQAAGLLVLLPHLGNWEIFNVYYRRHGEFTALYHPPRQPYMKDIMQIVRTRRGNHMVPTDRSGLMALFRALNHGNTVVVLPDQVPAQGVFADFFGEPVLTDTLSSRLLLKTGANAIGLSVVRRDDGRFDLHFLEPPAEIFSNDTNVSARAVNELVEQMVQLAPAQYQWEYKRLKERPAGSPKLYRYNKPPAVH